MTRKQMYYYLIRNNVNIADCNLLEENPGEPLYYLSLEEMEDIVADIIAENRAKAAERIKTEKAVILKGDKISALGLSFTVDRILYQEYLCGAFDCEFIDTKGNYHHWKQEFDGGNVNRWNGKQFVAIA